MVPFPFSLLIRKKYRPFAGRCPERMAVMKTVADLKKQIPFQRTRYLHVPTAKGLEKSGLRVVEESCFEENCRITVYENGYVAYRESGRYTVFSLYKVPDDYEECLESRFFSSFREDGTEIDGKDIVPEPFKNQIPWDWHLRVFAQERMLNNSIKADRKAAAKMTEQFFSGRQGVKKENSQVFNQVAQPSCEDELITKEMFQTAYRLLTPKQREAFELRIEGKLSYKQIAEECGSDVPAVGMLLKRAKKSLRDHRDQFF